MKLQWLEAVMQTVLESMLSNAVVVGTLTVLLICVGRRWSPALRHTLCVLLLVKLLTPSLLQFEVGLPALLPAPNPFSSFGARQLSLLDTEPPVEPPVEPSNSPAITTAESLGVVIDDFATHDVAVSDVPINDIVDAYELPELSSFDTLPRDPVEATAGPPVGTVDLSGDQGLNAAGGMGPAASEIRRLSLGRALFLIMLVGSLAYFGLTGIQLVRLWIYVRRLASVAGGLQVRAEEIGNHWGLNRVPRILVAHGSLPPMLVSFVTTHAVVLPADLLKSLSESQVGSILAHELAHYRRGDHWLRWLEILVTGLYWWHPLVWLLRRELHEAEEQCCDSWVMQAFPDRAKGYAQALMATVDFLAGDPVRTTAGVSALNPVYSFRRRLEMILQPTSVPQLSRRAKVSLAALSLAVLLGAPRLPAQQTVPDSQPRPPIPAAAVAPTAPVAPQAPAAAVAPEAPAAPAATSVPLYAPTPPTAPTIAADSAAALGPSAAAAAPPGGSSAPVPRRNYSYETLPGSSLELPPEQGNPSINQSKRIDRVQRQNVSIEERLSKLESMLERLLSAPPTPAAPIHLSGPPQLSSYRPAGSSTNAAPSAANLATDVAKGVRYTRTAAPTQSLSLENIDRRIDELERSLSSLKMARAELQNQRNKEPEPWSRAETEHRQLSSNGFTFRITTDQCSVAAQAQDGQISWVRSFDGESVGKLQTIQLDGQQLIVLGNRGRAVLDAQTGRLTSETVLTPR